VKEDFNNNWKKEVVRCPDKNVPLGNWSQVETKSYPPDWCPSFLTHLKLEGKLRDYLSYMNHE
jgi:hypothetical protein